MANGTTHALESHAVTHSPAHLPDSTSRQEAFTLLVTQATPKMLAVARRILRREADVADVLQEAYLHAFRAWGDFRGEADSQTWLYRIVVRQAIGWQKKRSTLEHSIDDLLPTYRPDGHRVDPGSAWPSGEPSGEMETRELQQLVRAKIQELPESLRLVVILRDIEELDTRQTAEMLELSEELVKVRLHRARQALRTLLDPHMRDKP